MKPRWSKSLAKAIPLPKLFGHFGSLALIIMAAMSLLVSILVPSAFQNIRITANDVFAPMVHTIGKPLRDSVAFARNISGVAQLQSDNARLKEQNIKLREWYQTALKLEAENKSLKQLLNVKTEPEHKFISARVMMDTGRSFVKSFVVAAGVKDGVKKGNAVISSEGLLGRVIEVGNNTSRVLLLNDINSRIPVLIENSSQHAILSGNNTQRPTLEHLPLETTIAIGARVITSGYGGVFPKGLPVGVVEYSKNNELYVRPYSDFDQIVYARIIDPGYDFELNKVTQ